jgi:hypothetical protein
MSLSMLWDMWENKGEVVGGLLEPFSEENVKQNIDENWSSLKNIGISEGLLQGKPTTTEANFSESLGNTIYNLPSQIPRFTKEIVGAVYNPLELVEGVHGLGQGLLTNAADVFYDALLPDKLFNLLKENQPEEITKNEKMMEAAGEALLDPQVRREIAQQYGLDGLLAWASMPNSAFKLSSKLEKKLQKAVTATAPFGNTIGTQMMVGELAARKLGKTADLDKAKKLHSEGVDANTIWKETGFGLAQDGKWRTEIDDSGASLKDIREHPMDTNLIITGDDYLNHASLLEALPELADLDVKPYRFNLEGGGFGYFAKDGGNPEVGFNPMASKSLEEYSASPEAQKSLALGKTLHEFQHAAQNIEGHAGGSSPRAEQSKILQATGAVEQARDEINKIKKRLEEDTSLTKDEKIALFNQQKLFEEDIVNIERYAAIQGDDNYRNKVLGELEAFSTQKRVGMSAEERRNQIPSYLLANDVLLRGDDFAEGRRLLSDSLRYEGMSPTEAQALAAGYGKDRIMDDNLRRALENKEIIPDYVKEGGLLSEEPVSLRDYAGRSVIFPMADTSATGQTTMEVAGKELAKGSKDEGGQAFALDNPDLAWANDEKAMSTLMNNLTEAQKLSKDPPLIMPWQMGGGAINFSVQMSDTMIQAARANLTNAEMKVIDDKVRAQKYLQHFKDKNGKKIKPSVKVKLNPNFKGIKNVDLTELTGMQRIALIGHLDTNAKSKIGSMLEHQLANADPTQLFTDPFTLHNVMEADLSKGILDSPHRTYNKAVGGSFQGRIKEPVSLLDLIDAQTKAGKPITTETIKKDIAPQNKSLMGQKLHTVLTEERIDRAIKLGEERLKQKKNNKK